MTTKPASLGIIHKILIVFVAINIVGDIGNVAFWWANPASRAASLNTGYIGINAGVSNALTAGTVILLLVSVVYIVALYDLLKRKIWAPKIIIAISVVNRALALILYFISPAFAFWAVWSIILIAISYFDWSKMNKATNTALPAAAPTTIS
jgi:uncharacterized membrane protein YoaK (UPF0700 family)